MVIKIKADTNKNNIAKKARQIMMNPNADKLCMVIPRLINGYFLPKKPTKAGLIGEYVSLG